MGWLDRIGEAWFACWRRHAGLRMVIEFTGAIVIVSGVVGLWFDYNAEQADRLIEAEERKVREEERLERAADRIAREEERAERAESRLARMWELATDPRPGNSGKIPALIFLNSNDHSLQGIEIPKAYLKGLELKNADLKGVDFSGANLIGADLSGSDLSHANLTGADLTNATLVGVNLTGATASQANFYEANLTNAVIFRANFTDSNLTSADLSKVSFNVGNISWSLQRARERSPVSLILNSLFSANFSGARLGNVKGVKDMASSYQCEDRQVKNLSELVVPPLVFKCDENGKPNAN